LRQLDPLKDDKKGFISPANYSVAEEIGLIVEIVIGFLN